MDGPTIRNATTSRGRVDYAKLEETPLFESGIASLQEIGDRIGPVALLCSEEDPNKCHRYRSVGHVLLRRGIDVSDIRGDGRLEAQSRLEAEEDSGQMTLFGLEVKQRRSLQPVLPARPRSDFSEN